MYCYNVPRRANSPEEVLFGVEVGRALKRARQDRDLSGSNLSALSGVSIDAIRSIESGRIASPGLLVSSRMTRALSLSLDDLIADVQQEMNQGTSQ